MYDPGLDDQDEAWVAEQITKGGGKGAKTDAILTCPMCFSPLSYNCQRHERYPNQYRAMFVTNCRVVKSERFKDKQSNEAFYPVNCGTCDTHVAMMDEDEVYHFFNTIAS
ncbi:E2F-associated phosphoprotein-domain-containing protein [Dichotomocladium elegans]|nr:E2F-associated phosphoprotein-domain-containing protein [Dichotomocladium elegans]